MLLKKLLFPLFSIFLLYQSFQLLANILSANESFSLPLILAFAFLFNLFLTGVFAFIGFAYPSHKLLPQRYYEIKNPKKIQLIYKNFGVKYFKSLLMLAFWGTKKNRKKYFGGNRAGLRNLVFQSKQSEFGHFGAFVIVTLGSFFILSNVFYTLFIAINLINILGNFYPIILQRHHRMRVSKLI